MPDPTADLRTELEALRAALARRLREKIESEEGATPAWLDVARKFLSDQDGVLDLPPAPVGPPVVRDLPFRASREEE